MRDQRTSDSAERPIPEDVLEHGVLHYVLSEHPAPVIFDELVRGMWEERFIVEDAVKQLIADGLLHRLGDLVLATRAAVRFDELGS
jgi:hypothetical protein